MDIFGMGMGEIILVIVVAIMIFGPGKIPEIARTVGKVVNTIKQTSSDLTNQITKEIDIAEELKREHTPPTVSVPPVAPAPASAAIKPPDLPPSTPQSGVNTGED